MHRSRIRELSLRCSNLRRRLQRRLTLEASIHRASIRGRFGGVGFRRAPSFSAAGRKSDGHDSPQVVAWQLELIASTRAVEDPEFLHLQSLAQQVSAVLNKLDLGTQTVKVIDVGGQDGALFYEMMRCRPDTDWDWWVVETPELVAAMNRNGLACELTVQGSTIRWIANSDDATAHVKNSVVIASGVLMLLDRPYDYLRQWAHGAKAIVLDKVFTQARLEDVPVIRRSPLDHTRRFPAWILSEKRLRAEVVALGELEQEWCWNGAPGSKWFMAFEGLPVAYSGFAFRC